MITVTVTQDTSGHVRAFTVDNHSDNEVCAAVSLLVLNTVNSIEALTDEAFTCDYNEDGGFLHFSLNGKPRRKAELLLQSMMLGLVSVRERYGNEIQIKEVKL